MGEESGMSTAQSTAQSTGQGGGAPPAKSGVGKGICICCIICLLLVVGAFIVLNVVMMVITLNNMTTSTEAEGDGGGGGGGGGGGAPPPAPGNNTEPTAAEEETASEVVSFANHLEKTNKPRLDLEDYEKTTTEDTVTVTKKKNTVVKKKVASVKLANKPKVKPVKLAVKSFSTGSKSGVETTVYVAVKDGISLKVSKGDNSSHAPKKMAGTVTSKKTHNKEDLKDLGKENTFFNGTIEYD